MLTYYPVLSIAGSDCSGGAGIQADIKTISSTGCYAMAAITAITAQNTTGVESVEGVTPSMVEAQLRMVFDDIPPMAVKTGMLYSADIVNTVADTLERYKARNIVVDPVMIATSGARLIAEDASDALCRRLLPLATVVTPNRQEAVALSGGATDPDDQIARLRELGCTNILLKGGDDPDSPFSTDLLVTDGSTDIIELKADRVRTENTHGTGCTLSSAIASFLALGFPVTDAVKAAKSYITRALISGRTITAGHGHGPVNHLFAPRKAKIQKI